MKTILKDISTGRFFKGPGQWTLDPTEARDFKLIDRALQFINQYRLHKVQVVFAFANRQEVVSVPKEKLGKGYTEN